MKTFISTKFCFIKKFYNAIKKEIKWEYLTAFKDKKKKTSKGQINTYISNISTVLTNLNITLVVISVSWNKNHDYYIIIGLNINCIISKYKLHSMYLGSLLTMWFLRLDSILDSVCFSLVKSPNTSYQKAYIYITYAIWGWLRLIERSWEYT